MLAYNKALVALIMALIGVVNTFFGLGIDVNPDMINALVLLITPALVYFVPNKPKV